MLSSSNLNNILNNNFNNNQNRKNIIKNYSNKILRSEMAMVNSDLLKDYMNVIDGNCIYIRNFFCKDNDFTILKDITNDILDKSKNSNEQQKVWPLVESERNRMSSKIRNLYIPVKEKIDKGGRPYKLILTKTDELHKESKKRYNNLLGAIEDLKSVKL